MRRSGWERSGELRGTNGRERGRRLGKEERRCGGLAEEEGCCGDTAGIEAGMAEGTGQG